MNIVTPFYGNYIVDKRRARAMMPVIRRYPNGPRRSASPAFTDDNAAREAMETVMWPHGARCPRCQSLERIGKVSGKSARPGLYYCGECERQFTVTVGTILSVPRCRCPSGGWRFT